MSMAGNDCDNMIQNRLAMFLMDSCCHSEHERIPLPRPHHPLLQTHQLLRPLHHLLRHHPHRLLRLQSPHPVGCMSL